MMLSNAYAEERGKAPVSSYAHALVAGALLDRHLEEQRLFFLSASLASLNRAATGLKNTGRMTAASRRS
jgi:hypothetical protein